MGLFGNDSKSPYLFNSGTDGDNTSDSCSSFQSVSDTDNMPEEDEEYEAEYEIDFWHYKKLVGDAIMFKILDTDLEVAGYAIASSCNNFEILGTDYGGFEDSDIKYLKKQLQQFCMIYYSQNSES